MHAYREFTQPTVVSHSVAAELDGPGNGAYLCVVRGGSLLEIFSIISLVRDTPVSDVADLADASLAGNEDSFIGGEISVERMYKHRAARLLAHFPLDGKVMAMGKIRRGDRPNDCLVLVFEHAKMVVLEWQCSTRSINSLSLHYYEKEIEEYHFKDYLFQPVLAIDPNPTTQGIALMFQRDTLAFLTFPPQYDDENAPSFNESVILQTTDLNASCQNVVHIAFLYSYKDPTIGLLYQTPDRSWTGSLARTKDTSAFMAVSVDFQGRRSTPIVAAEGLPSDVAQLIPLRAPIRGTLILGSNCLLHIDTSGRVIAMAVNEFAALASDYPMTDRSELGLNLEGAVALQIGESASVVLVLGSGLFAILKFTIEGSRILGFDLDIMDSPAEVGDPSTIQAVDGNCVFVGSNTADSALLSWRYGHGTESKSADATMLDEEDDIYNVTSDMNEADARVIFKLDHQLRSLGPIQSLTTMEMDGPKDERATFIVAACGSEKSGALAILSKTVDLLVRDEVDLPRGDNGRFPKRIWNLGSYMISADKTSSRLFQVPSFKEIPSDQFKNLITLEAHMLDESTSVQALRDGIVVHNFDFGASNRVKLPRETLAVAAEANYLLVKNDVRISLYEIQLPGKPGKTRTTKPTAAKLEDLSVNGDFIDLLDNRILVVDGNKVMFANVEDPETVQSFDLSNLDKLLEASADGSDTEIDPETDVELEGGMLANLGTTDTSDPYLCVGNDGDLVLYEIIESVTSEGEDETKRTHLVKRLTIPSSNHVRVARLAIGKFRVLVTIGQDPWLVIKSVDSPLRAHPLNTGTLLDAAVSNGQLLLLGPWGRLDVCELDFDIDYTSTGWLSRKIVLGETVTGVTYMETARLLVAGTNISVPREPEKPEELDGENEHDREDLAEVVDDLMESEAGYSTTYTGKIHLISPETWSVASTTDLLPGEALVCIQSVSLEISGTTRFREYLAVGTSLLLDENFASNGNLYLFTVPGGGRRDHESRKALFQVHQELVRGAVTGICESMGRLIIGQGQRVLARSIQDDHSVEPVAFLDTEVYVSDVKSVRNMLIVGDLQQNLWLATLAAEPQNLYLVAKDYEDTNGTMCAEFVSEEYREDLYVVSADLKGVLRLLQFEPENPKSLVGTRLISEAFFNTSRQVTCMNQITSADVDIAALGGCADGTLCVVYPISETEYRSLFVLTQQMMDKEQPTACLNPRMHRALGAPPSQRPMIDVGFAEKFWTLDASRQLHYARKLGREGLDQVYDVMLAQYEAFGYL